MTAEDLKRLEETLWKSADTLRANSDLKSSEYFTPVMGLIFLKFADNRYGNHKKEIIQEYNELKGTRREKPISEIAVEQCGFYLPDHTPVAQRVKLAAKSLLQRLTKGRPRVLIEDWYKDSQTQAKMRSEVEEILDKTLPASYDKQLFQSKRDNVYDLIYEYSVRHLKWAV